MAKVARPQQRGKSSRVAAIRLAQVERVVAANFHPAVSMVRGSPCGVLETKTARGFDAAEAIYRSAYAARGGINVAPEETKNRATAVLALWVGRNFEDAAALVDRFRDGGDHYNGCSSPKRLATLLRLKQAQRLKMGVNTLGATDMTREQMKKAAAERKRLKKAEKRRAEGRRDNSKSDARLKPWVAMGISRATYYRHGKQPVINLVADDEDEWTPQE